MHRWTLKQAPIDCASFELLWQNTVEVVLLSALSRWCQSGLKSGRVRGSGSTKVRFFQANFRKIPIFSGKFSKNFGFFRKLKNFDFPGKNCSFTATSGQIVLFLFKTHHFRTYFLYIIIIIMFHDPITTPLRSPHDPLPKIWELRHPQPPGLTPLTHFSWVG